MNRKLARLATLLRFRLAALAFADSIEEHAAAVRDALAAGPRALLAGINRPDDGRCGTLGGKWEDT